MRVSTRIVLGFGILMFGSITALTYQVYIIIQMESINQHLSEVNFQAAATIQKMERATANIEDSARKVFALKGDEMYEKELADSRAEMARYFVELQINSHTERELQAIKELSREWQVFWDRFAIERERINPYSSDLDMPNTLHDAIDNIMGQTQFTWTAVQASIREQVERAAAAGSRARNVSLIAGAASVFIGFLVAFISLRAISDPLRQLTQGTRRVAKGQFWHRLPADGSDEFAELARDFNSMAQNLGELDQMKKDFVSHVSHELKAPLASMRQVFHLLLMEIAGTLNDQQKRLLRLSSTSAERLTAMVGNLLDVSRMEAGTMEYDIHPRDLYAIVRSVAEEFEVQAHERNIEIRVESESDTWAECDRDRIIQVIGNLFENALKFAPAGSAVIVRIRNIAGGKVTVSVSDTGPGVPDAHKQKVFEKFHQVKQGKKIAGQSVGLGLAICKTIVEAHNGTISVEDNPGGGSVFYFTLNAAVPSAASSDTVSVAGQT